MQLTPEQVNDFLSKAILESKIGETVKKAVDRAIEQLSRGYDNPFDGAIKSEVHALIETEIREKYRAQIQERIEKSIATVLTADFLDTFVAAGLKAVKDRY
jgi:FixJ family two-component response regulator